METVLQLILGLLFALGLGHFAVEKFLTWLRKRMGLPSKPQQSAGTAPAPPWLTGMVERFFFTLVVAFDVSGAATAMVGWMGAKLAANWNRPDLQGQTDEEKVTQARFAFSALLAGALSMTFALIGGLIAKGP
jgi:hypothetical protein